MTSESFYRKYLDFFLLLYFILPDDNLLEMALNVFTTLLALLAAFNFVANVLVFCTTKKKGVTWVFVIRYNLVVEVFDFTICKM